MNPLALATGSTLSNGNLEFLSGTSGYSNARSTIGVSSGKWYAEFDITVAYCYIGVALDQLPNTSYGGDSVYGWVYHPTAGDIYHNSVNTSYGASFSTDLIGVALDADNRTVTWYKNGVSQGSYDLGSDAKAGDTFFFIGSGYISDAYTANFGQRPFAYTPPTGYKSLCTQNLDNPTIADGSDYFDVALDTGANILSSTKALCGGNANFLWIKDRDNATTNHHLIDIVRDPQLDGTPYLISNDTDDEATLGTYSAPSGNSVGWAWNGGSSNTPISAGGLNSSVYDQSQTWSSSVTNDRTDFPAANAFDGDSTSIAYAPNTQSTTVTFGSSISVTTLRILIDKAGTGTNGIILNGSTDVASQLGSSGWNTITGVTSLSSITYKSTSGSDYVGIYAVEVNGKILVDSNETPPNVPSIASTVRANPSSGFSIITYTGNLTGNGSASVAHGLNATPELIITKQRDGSSRWTVQHKDLADNYLLVLDTPDSSADYSFGDLTDRTSSVFSTNYTAGMNTNGDDFIAYCFAPVEGYSKFGSYTGNGDANGDGPFVFTGFRPAFVLIKSTGSGNWYLYDTAREENNVTAKRLYPNLPNLEDTGAANFMDIVSNGFKLRHNNAGINANNQEFIYAAFAEHPFKTARAR